MKRIRNPEQKRKQIIEATNRILRDGGHYTKFSLDKVAQEAGISKGGLMHHFPSKAALLQAVAQAATERFESHFYKKLAAEPDELGRKTRAYIKTVLGDGSGTPPETSPVLLAFLRAAADDPTARTRFDYWQEIIQDDGLDEAKAALIRLAVDGLLYTEVIDNVPLAPALRRSVCQALLQLVDESVST